MKKVLKIFLLVIFLIGVLITPIKLFTLEISNTKDNSIVLVTTHKPVINNFSEEDFSKDTTLNEYCAENDYSVLNINNEDILKLYKPLIYVWCGIVCLLVITFIVKIIRAF